MAGLLQICEIWPCVEHRKQDIKMPMGAMLEPKTEQQAASGARISPDMIVEDLVGLNIQGVKTIIDLFLRPSRVFSGARLADWGGRYRPSVRLSLFVVTLMMALSFFWAGEDSPLYQGLADFIETARQADPGSTFPADFVDRWFATYLVVFPFFYVAIHTLIASAVFIWGKETPFVARIRLYFCLVVVGITYALGSIIIIPFLGVEEMAVYNFISVGISLALYGLTYWRGIVGVHAGLGRLWRAVLIAFIVLIGDLIVNVVAGSGASQYIEMTAS